MRFHRHEFKYYLNDIQSEGLQRQLSHLMSLDENSPNANGYRVRSLYFDSPDDECLFEKQSGIQRRQKFRLRIYGDGSATTAKFEIKRKDGLMVRKDSAAVGRAEAIEICNGNYALLLDHENPVLDEIYAIFSSRAYKPKVIVEYRRVAFTLPISNIRITFDLDLHSNINHLELFSDVKDCVPVVLEGKQILEVKYDQYLPAYIRRLISGARTERMAISKYTLARRFHKTHKWEDN